MTVVLYGIPNCDTVKKARAWLAERGIEHRFHDYKKQGTDPERIAGWVARAGLARVLNKAGTTYKKLPEAAKAELEAENAASVLAAHPSTIKRPIVEYDGGLLVGFDADAWKAAIVPSSAMASG